MQSSLYRIYHDVWENKIRKLSISEQKQRQIQKYIEKNTRNIDADEQLQKENVDGP
jgi:hypothetical protein